MVCGFVGVTIAGIDLMYPHRFSTVLEVDFDTPYDRHIIIEDSHHHRKKRWTKTSDEVVGFGRRILRYKSILVHLLLARSIEF